MGIGRDPRVIGVGCPAHLALVVALGRAGPHCGFYPLRPPIVY